MKENIGAGCLLGWNGGEYLRSKGLLKFTGREKKVDVKEEEDLPIYHHSQLSIGGCDVKKAPVAVDSHFVLA